jgi:hypothetical protein
MKLNLTFQILSYTLIVPALLFIISIKMYFPTGAVQVMFRSIWDQVDLPNKDPVLLAPYLPEI